MWLDLNPWKNILININQRSIKILKFRIDDKILSTHVLRKFDTFLGLIVIVFHEVDFLCNFLVWEWIKISFVKISLAKFWLLEQRVLTVRMLLRLIRTVLLNVPYLRQRQTKTSKRWAVRHPLFLCIRCRFLWSPLPHPMIRIFILLLDLHKFLQYPLLFYCVQFQVTSFGYPSFYWSVIFKWENLLFSKILFTLGVNSKVIGGFASFWFDANLALVLLDFIYYLADFFRNTKFIWIVIRRTKKMRKTRKIWNYKIIKI